MNNLSFLQPSSLALLSYMHITKDFHNFLLKTPENLSAYTQQIQIPLQQITSPLPISYTILLESVFIFECLEQSSTNFTNTLIQVSKSPITRFLKTTISHILKNGSPISYMTVLDVNAKITLI